MSNYKPRIESNNLDLTSILSTINELPDAGGGTAQGSVRFNIDGGQLTLNKMRLTGPGAQVAINGGSLTMTDCVFDTSYLVAQGGTTALVGCTFLNESAMYQVTGNLIMTDCVFTDCEVQLGDQYEYDGIILTFTNCHFNNCSLGYTDEAYAALVAGGNYINGVLIT